MSSPPMLTVVPEPSPAERMMRLFGGARANGYRPEMTAPDADGKVRPVEVYKWTRPPTVAMWEKHIRGEVGIGIIPPNEGGKVAFGAIDVDDYTVSVPGFAAKIKQQSLPLTVARTKSGGAHLYLFAREPTDPELMERALQNLAARLGLKLKEAGVEGQTEIIVRANIWMPHCGPARPGVKASGSEMTVVEFLHRAEEARQSAAAIAELAASRPTPAEAPSEAEGAAHAERRLALYRAELASTPAGGRNSKLNVAAHEMGRMIGAGWIEQDPVEQALRQAALECGLSPAETEGTLRRAIKGGMKKPAPEIATLITEDSAALEFGERHANALLFDHDAGKWFQWTASHWAIEKTQLAFCWARDLARDLARDKNARVRSITSKAAFAASVERFARSDRTFAVTAKDWDLDLMLLGTPAGTVDLRDGMLRAARPEDRITKVTATAPAEEADCPLWRKFLDETLQSDGETITFLQRLCGYALTGDTREHVLVFVYGPGGNGKSVFLNTIVGVLGDYARVAPMETFTASHTDRHPTDLAMLRGAWLVTANETEEGRAWAETRIKQLTGGDQITARFMRRDFFTYQPQFKLVIVGNHQPALHNVNEAMRRRFAIVPFVNRPEQPDHELEAKLRDEWSGILRWMIEGCLDWQAKGLPRPDAVETATANYFETQDMLGQFLAERCEPVPVGASPKGTASGVLYGTWVKFALAAGEEPGSQKSFGQAMEQRGWQRHKDGRGRRMYLGIRLRSYDAGGGGP